MESCERGRRGGEAEAEGPSRATWSPGPLGFQSLGFPSARDGEASEGQSRGVTPPDLKHYSGSCLCNGLYGGGRWLGERASQGPPSQRKSERGRARDW